MRDWHDNGWFDPDISCLYPLKGEALRFLLLWLCLLFAAPALADQYYDFNSHHGGGSLLTPEQLGVVVNDADPISVEVSEYYMQARRVPAKNLVHVSIANNPHKLSVQQFSEIKQQINAQLGPDIQAVVMLWTAPYAVGCNSITSAFTLGYDAAQCANICAPGKPNPYFNSPSLQPYTDFGLRISMLLPTESVAQAKALIDRGVLSAFRIQPANAYFLSTSDTARNVRAQFFPKSGNVPQRQLAIKTLQANTLENADDIMFYQVGLPVVSNLDTLHFLPGALADHLTSFGGDLLGNNGQMSSLRWLAAGATASYGTVSEPCSHWQKFPHPQMLLKSYLSGATAIEAYWKSVAWPTQGVFIGEPLAAPYHH
jgi:uncharacterized protein (TIGR03790 family)